MWYKEQFFLHVASLFPATGYSQLKRDTFRERI